MSEKEVVVTDWDKVYENSYQSGGWSYLSRMIIRTIEHELGNVKGKKMIELGCGSGRNSLRLAKKGADVALLDLSQQVLDKAHGTFDREGVSAQFIQGNIFDIPVADNTFPVVWNAGVIEHWVGDEQVECIREMLRICTMDGIVVTLNPNKRSFFHEYGKKVLGLFGQYAYTDEENILTLETQAVKAGGKLQKKEYSIGFFVLFVGLFIQFRANKIIGPPTFFIFKILNKIFTVLDASFLGKPLYSLDKLLCKIFGGYLLVSVLKK